MFMETKDNIEHTKKTEKDSDNIENINKLQENDTEKIENDETNDDNEAELNNMLKKIADEIKKENEKEFSEEEVNDKNDSNNTNKRKKKTLKEQVFELLKNYKPIRESQMKKRPLITRDQWGAREPLERVDLKFPVHKVLFVQTKTEECFNKEDCIKIIQRLQNQHMDERGLPDIQYNFLVGSDKNVYEGRGWSARPDKNEKYPELFDKKIEYAYIGTYDYHEPPERIQKAAWKLLEDGIIFHKLFEKFRVFEDYYQPSSRVEDLVKKYVTKDPIELKDSEQSHKDSNE